MLASTWRYYLCSVGRQCSTSGPYSVWVAIVSFFGDGDFPRCIGSFHIRCKGSHGWFGKSGFFWVPLPDGWTGQADNPENDPTMHSKISTQWFVSLTKKLQCGANTKGDGPPKRTFPNTLPIVYADNICILHHILMVPWMPIVVMLLPSLPMYGYRHYWSFPFGVAQVNRMVGETPKSCPANASVASMIVQQ